MLTTLEMGSLLYNVLYVVLALKWLLFFRHCENFFDLSFVYALRRIILHELITECMERWTCHLVQYTHKGDLPMPSFSYLLL